MHATTPQLLPTWGRWYWTVWFFLSFGSFLGPEIYALSTNWTNTLSAWVWRFEEFKAGQSFWLWSAGHFIFTGVYLVTTTWLFGHFVLGFWRS